MGIKRPNPDRYIMIPLVLLLISAILVPANFAGLPQPVPIGEFTAIILLITSLTFLGYTVQLVRIVKYVLGPVIEEDKNRFEQIAE